MTTAPAIETDNLVAVFPGRGRRAEPVRALDGLSLRVEPGEVFGFLGPNGAGKTTAIQILLGFVSATGGTARLFGEDVRLSIARQRIGYLAEQPQFPGFLTAREFLRFAAGLFRLPRGERDERIERLLDRTGLTEAADRRIALYSRGMLQRLGLAQALVNHPDLVVLDEPTNGLDPLGRLEVRDLIAKLKSFGKTVFFSSHELSEVERVCDRVALLNRGRVVAQGPIPSLVAPGDSLEQFFIRTVNPGGGGPS